MSLDLFLVLIAWAWIIGMTLRDHFKKLRDKKHDELREKDQSRNG